MTLKKLIEEVGREALLKALSGGGSARKAVKILGVSHTTLALTHATLPYVLDLANKGWIQAVKEDSALAQGVNVVLGKITNPGVAEAHGLPYYKLEEVLKELGN